MNSTGKYLLLLAVLGPAFSSQAITPDDRYNMIVERNIFRLTSPPPPPPITPTNDPLDRKIELSGITRVGGEKKAWFIVPPKAGSKDLPLYFTLGENQGQDFLEVVSISEEMKEVKIKNSGNPMILSFTNNAPKAVSGPGVPAPAPVAAVNTGVVPPQPAVLYNGGNANYGGANAGSYGSAGRGVTVTGGSGSSTGTAHSGLGQPSEGGLRTIPTRNLRVPPSAAVTAPEAPIDPVAQRALMEIQQAQAQQSGQAIPPLPPLPQ
ncbi:MAG: hypothetical protein ABIP71_01885 [Verrucomicrobiota bacterium]